MYHSLPVHVQEFFFLVCTCVQKVIFTGSTFGKLLSSPDITFFKLPKMFVQACTISAELKPKCVFFGVLCTYQAYTINYLMISSCIIKQCSPYLLELNYIEYLNTKMHSCKHCYLLKQVCAENIPRNNSTFFSCEKAFLCFSFKELLSSKVVYLQIQVAFSCFFGAAQHSSLCM